MSNELVWTPLPNGYNTGRIGNYEIQIGIDSGTLYIFNIRQNRKCWTIDLPADIAICKASAREIEQQPIVSQYLVDALKDVPPVKDQPLP